MARLTQKKKNQLKGDLGRKPVYEETPLAAVMNWNQTSIDFNSQSQSSPDPQPEETKPKSPGKKVSKKQKVDINSSVKKAVTKTNKKKN